ncbi:hypothetical protein B0T10DRAFT_447550 [Thelonectria olida]|uniref:FAD-binding domain-containing protein n=1 Tax=Thelonectria olida TaxID=1576542 RepID=A0A9P9AJH4_9HYPO|nr:hypothetical protein B0T10DRAFT_447550 [Thelonectria olida]
MTSGNFKVIIVGGGPAGLVAAHALYQANIDFVVLEQREEVTVDLGACLVLGPQNLRVMHQLGLLGKLRDIGGELLSSKAFLLSGYEYKHSTDLQTLKDNHGAGLVAFHRAQLIQTIYDELDESAKARYFTNKKVADIASTGEGVLVTCTDGSTYDGSIILGADGVHSVTRRLMRTLALQQDPNAVWDDENPFTTEYKCMWCSFPRPSEPGVSFETTHKDQSVMYITGPERGWILAYEKFPEPTKERHDYTDKDIEDFGQRIAEFPVNETLKVKDVFSRRLTAGIADLQEGIVKNWSWGRIVLVGDACHKFTPNAGLGLNNGIQDVVVLSNLLHSAIQTSPNGVPTNETLTDVFQRYRETRAEPLQKDYDKSALVTRLHAWVNSIHYVLNRFILSQNFVTNLMARFSTSPAFRKGFVLDYVRAAELPAGRVTWEHAIPSPTVESQL